MNKLIFLLLVVLITGCAQSHADDVSFISEKVSGIPGITGVYRFEDFENNVTCYVSWQGGISCLPSSFSAPLEGDGCAPGHAEDFNGDCIPIHPPASPYLSN